MPVPLKTFKESFVLRVLNWTMLNATQLWRIKRARQRAGESASKKQFLPSFLLVDTSLNSYCHTMFPSGLRRSF